MTSRALLLLAVPALFLAGGALGFLARRHEEAIVLPPVRRRPPHLEKQLEDHERGGRPPRPYPGEVWVLVDTRGPPYTREDRAEAQLMWALSIEGTKALQSVDREFPDTHASARAHWETILRMPEGPERDGLLALFRERHPGAWVLRTEPSR